MSRSLYSVLFACIITLVALTGCGSEAQKADDVPDPTPLIVMEPAVLPTPFVEPEMEQGGPAWFDGNELPSGRLIKNGIEYVFLSEVAEALDTTVQQSEDGKLFTLPWRKDEVKLSSEKAAATYLKKERLLETPPILCKKATDLLVPVRSFCEAAEIGVYDDVELGELTCTPGTGDWELKGGYNVCVMMYHGIGYAPPEANLILSAQSLEQQFQYLNEHGFTSIWFEDLWHVEDFEKPIILIFDDGWHGCYPYLYPLCEKYQIKAAVAIITDDPDKYGNRINTAEMAEMRESPYLTFYSHSVNHEALDSMPLDRVEYEMWESERWITRFFHREPVTFVYPIGASTPFVQQLTQKYYRFGVKMVHPDIRAGKAWTSYNTSDDPTLVYRYFVQRQTQLQTYATWIEYPFLEADTVSTPEEDVS